MTDAPTPTPPVTTPTKPGWKTSEAWLSFLAMVIGSLPSSGLLPASGESTKIVGLAITLLAALGYTASRTAVKS